jgi:SAM-dependent methyltransferase
MYDDFSTDYDHFVDWPARLAAELPFIERMVAQAVRPPDREADRPPCVLDAACGTGMHAVALARQGWRVAGADTSPGMIARARENAQVAGVEVRFDVAGFGELSTRFGGGFDGLLCLGNSLPHILTPQALHAALADFAACLRPGGVLLVQNLNYDRILARRERWMEPQTHREGETEWLFLRFYDFDPDGLLTFHVVRLRRAGGPWEQQVLSARLRPLRQAELTDALKEAGFSDIALYGDMQSSPFDPDRSPNLVIGAIRE